MDVIWDPDKANSNFAKHSVDFADAAVALEDPNALTIVDEDVNELRFKTLALSPDSNILLIVHAEQDEEDAIRIISARRADKTEEKQYFQGDNHER